MSTKREKIKGYIKEFFSLNDDVVSTMMIIIIIAFFFGVFLLVRSSMANGWNIDDTAFSVFYGTFITAGIIKIVSEKIGAKNENSVK